MSCLGVGNGVLPRVEGYRLKGMSGERSETGFGKGVWGFGLLLGFGVLAEKKFAF